MRTHFVTTTTNIHFVTLLYKTDQVIQSSSTITKFSEAEFPKGSSIVSEDNLSDVQTWRCPSALIG